MTQDNFKRMQVRHISRAGNEYHIEYDPPPIPIRSFDFQWAAEDFDPTEDGGDTRSGAEATRQACIDAIEEYEENE